MKILRKMIALVMVTIMAAMLFASCKPADETQTTPGASGTQSESNDPNAPAKPEKLTIWLQKTFSDEFNNAFAQLFQDFGKENGIAISTGDRRRGSASRYKASRSARGKELSEYRLYGACEPHGLCEAGCALLRRGYHRGTRGKWNKDYGQYPRYDLCGRCSICGTLLGAVLDALVSQGPLEGGRI